MWRNNGKCCGKVVTFTYALLWSMNVPGEKEVLGKVGSVSKICQLSTTFTNNRGRIRSFLSVILKIRCNYIKELQIIRVNLGGSEYFFITTKRKPTCCQRYIGFYHVSKRTSLQQFSTIWIVFFNSLSIRPACFDRSNVNEFLLSERFPWNVNFSSRS